MTDDTHATHHIDDEVLSSLLDGELPDGGAAAHLAGCGECERRRQEMAAAAVLLATPVDPLPDDLRRALVFRALEATNTAAPDAPVRRPASRPLASRPLASRPLASRPLASRRRGRWQEAPFRAAAAIVVVASLGAGLFVAVRAAARGSGNGPAVSAMIPHGLADNDGQGVFSPASPAVAAWTLQLRPVETPVPASCTSIALPDPAVPLAEPDAIDAPQDGRICLSLGRSLATVTAPLPVTLKGPGGLSGPDTLTLVLPAGAKLLPAFTGSAASEIAAVGDGAAVGVVTSVTRAGAGAQRVVISHISPAVAEYLYGLLSGS